MTLKNEIMEEFDKGFPMPMKKVERMRDLGINVAYTTVGERILEEQEWNIAMNTWNNHRDFISSALDKQKERMMEETKKIQGDPFKDSDEFLDGITCCKATLLDNMKDL